VSDRPLITFLVVAYRQEQFIREALAGALAQTYAPLEIILSDDCSPDRTFEIIQEMAAAYHGSHTLVLNRNDRNLGLGSHINRLMELARGEYIVVAAGDDISLPERTEQICGEFTASGRKAMAVFSDLTEMDGAGKDSGILNAQPRYNLGDLEQMCERMFEGVAGASNAWQRKVFDCFGPMLPEIVFEDRVIAFRAALLGEIRHIARPLVKYRRHPNNAVAMFQSADPKQTRRTLQCFLSVYRNNARDLETFVQKIQPDFKLASRCRRNIRRRIRKLESYLQIFSDHPRHRAWGLVRLAVNGGNLLQGMKLCMRKMR
jgi:glycosyltransferase involved in cell wall biosynthesis